MSRDPYVDPATGVLRNLLGLHSAEELAAAERDLTLLTIYQIQLRPPGGRYDLDHLCAFHRAIFRDIYPWAGQVRTVAMARTDLFALPQHIVPYAARVFDALASEDHLRGCERGAFIDRLAHYYAEVNAVHPFRDGNGRTQRAFFGQLASEAGWRIAWERMDPDQNVAASAASIHGDNRPLIGMFGGLVDPLGGTR